MNRESISRAAVFLLCLLPFGYSLYGALAGALGPDPAEALMHSTGEWSARMLLLSLLVSPVRKWKPWRFVLKLRRMLGLYAFFYGVIHLISFAHFYLGWSSIILFEELVERPYITLGFGALLLMLPLVLTSTKAIQRRLGKNWLRLHRLVYLSSVLICAHIFWQIRSDAGEAFIYILLFAALLAWRGKRYLDKRKRAATAGSLAGAL